MSAGFRYLLKAFLAGALCLVPCAVILSGCSVLKDKTYTPTEAEQKLVEFCKKEGSIDIVARQVGRTEWIYLALEEPIFTIRANSSAANARRENMPFSVLSVDTGFEKKAFVITYDVVPDVLSQEPTTYGSAYNEVYTKKRQLIYQGIQETFFNLNKDEKTKVAAPVFFVIVIADAEKGIATRSTFYLPDLMAFMTEAIPFEEYYLREDSDIFGDEKLIGDKAGRNLKMSEVTWPTFLSRQIKNRIKFKFGHSDFPPKTDPDKVVVAIAANTIKLYPFNDYDAVRLVSRRDKREMYFSKELLPTFLEESSWEKNKGRIRVIQYQVPSDSDSSGQDDTSNSELPQE